MPNNDIINTYTYCSHCEYKDIDYYCGFHPNNPFTGHCDMIKKNERNRDGHCKFYKLASEFTI